MLMWHCNTRISGVSNAPSSASVCWPENSFCDLSETTRNYCSYAQGEGSACYRYALLASTHAKRQWQKLSSAVGVNYNILMATRHSMWL